MYKGLWPFLVGINLRIRRLGLANNGVYPVMSFERWSTIRFEGTIWPGIFLATFDFQVWIPQQWMISFVKPWISSNVPCFCIRGKHMVVQIKLLHFLVFAVLDGVSNHAHEGLWFLLLRKSSNIVQWDFHNTHTNLKLPGQVQACWCWFFLHPTSGWRYSDSTRNWDN